MYILSRSLEEIHRMVLPAARTVLSLLGLALWPSLSSGQEVGPGSPLQTKEITVEEAAAFRLDGLLLEAFWAEAPRISQLTQQEPAEGLPASEETHVMVLYDSENLYVGIRALDSEPDKIISRILQRDRVMVSGGFDQRPEFAGDDAVALLFDPFDDNRNAYVFATNPNGAEFDALLADEGKEFNVDWRGVWEVAGSRTPEGWSAEFKIPLQSLRYPNNSSRTWGFNVYRIIRRKNEKALWEGWSRDTGGFHRVSLAGALDGLANLPQTGRNLEVKPYVLSGARQTRKEDGSIPTEGEFEVGLDLKTEVRPGLVLDLTFNTDFAQVEVDGQQVNLTRFGLFFPEKRDFFLENSGIFQFGVAANSFEPPPFQMFFSRRIGIEEDEDEVVPILAGARLTGRLGGQTVGFMNVLTDRVEGLVDRESFSVARVKRDVGENNYLGFMATDRRSAEDWNTVLGVDGAFYLTPSFNVQSWLAYTFTKGEGGDDVAYSIMADYSTDRYGVFFRHIAVGPEAEARSGFIQRDDARRTDSYVRRSIRPGWGLVRKIDFMMGGNVFTGMSGGLMDWFVGPIIMTEFESGGQFTLIAQVGENRPDEEFDLADTLFVGPGTYDGDNIMMMGSTDPSKPVSLEGNARISRFYGGDLLNVGGVVNVAPAPQVAFALGLNRNRVEIPSGDFTANLLSLRAAYSFSTRLTTNLLVQYNSLDEAFTTNFRLNFIHRPGSDLFLVFTEERGDKDLQDTWRLTDRAMVVKFTYLKRF
jgi:hypothetical protein